MSNYTCPTCGTNHIDCGYGGYKTAKEVELEEQVKIFRESLRNLAYVSKDFIRILDKLVDNKLIEVCSKDLVVAECLTERLNALECAIRISEGKLNVKTGSCK